MAQDHRYEELIMAPTERAHAKIGPSSLARVMRCPGSVNFIENLDEPDSAGVFADEGTILHSFAEDCLNKGLDPFDLVGEQRTYNGYSYKLTEDDAQGILDGLEVIDDIPGELLVEKRVDLSRWMPDQFGTCDIAVIGKKRVTIADWKFGFKAVSPVENEQLMAYALGMWDNFARDLIPKEYHPDVMFKLFIFQPRAPGGGGEWEVSLTDLLSYGEKLRALMRKVADPKAPRCAGLWCEGNYCPGVKNRQCPEYDKFNLDMLVQDFDDLDDEVVNDLPMRLPRMVTPERRSHIIKHAPMIQKWLERLHAEMLDDALKGRPTPGFKAVEGRSPPRKWTDKTEAEEALVLLAPPKKVFTQRLITPTQAEKVLKPADYVKLAALIDKGEKKPSLVPEEDARPALRNIAEEFDDE